MTARPRSRPDPRLTLSVQYGVQARNLPSRATIRRWTRAALERDARVTVRIVGGSEGRSLNRRFRGRDHPTNVLTFVLREQPRLEGDLALCAPVIAREARAQRKTPSAHYAHRSCTACFTYRATTTSAGATPSRWSDGNRGS
jgi:probable rRNA maturation factor